MTTPDVCRKVTQEWRNNVSENAVKRNWRKLYYIIDQAYTVLHICSDTVDELSFNILQNHVYVTLAKLMFGYIYSDALLYGEYLIRVLKRNEEQPENIINEIHNKAMSKDDVLVDEIKNYVLKLLSAIVSYIYTPY